MKKLSILFVLTTLLAGCGSIHEKSPIGIGTDYGDLKKSPCACLQIKLEPGLPEWLVG